MNRRAAARLTRVSDAVDEGKIVIRKAFGEHTGSEWKWFHANRREIGGRTWAQKHKSSP